MEEQREYKIEQNGPFFKISGSMNTQAAEELSCRMSNDGTINTVDFDLVMEISFAALRSLLRARNSGKKFYIINASSKVLEKFEDSGVSFYINICRKPGLLELEKFKEFGASYMSTAFNSEDGDSIIKVYDGRVPKEHVAKEQMIARAVMLFGIPTPLVGSITKNGEKTSIEFERITGKRSFSRIISEEPERLEEITIRFARMCKELHSKPCDTTIFNDRRMVYKSCIEAATCITSQQRSKALAFIESIPKATTCLHGDMQLSNVITTGKEDLWIDLADFGYGYFMLDMGMWYFLSNLILEKNCINLFHMDKAHMRRCWEVFVKEYFKARTQHEMDDIEKEVEKYAALHMLFLGLSFGFEQGMMEYINEKLF